LRPTSSAYEWSRRQRTVSTAFAGNGTTGIVPVAQSARESPWCSSLVVLPVDGALDETDGDGANLPLLGGGEHVGLRVLRDELRLPALEDLLLRMPGVGKVDADEGDAARDRQADREPPGPAPEPTGPQQPHRPRIRPRSGGGIYRLAV
jgi:hypothetical protein